MTEREQIVAWLRDDQARIHGTYWDCKALANAIERGDHLQSSPTPGKVTATAEAVQALMSAFGQTYTGPRTEVAAYTAGLNAALAVMFPDQSKGGE